MKAAIVKYLYKNFYKRGICLCFLISEFKNISCAQIHENMNATSEIFWAYCGKDVGLLEVGGGVQGLLEGLGGHMNTLCCLL